MRVSPELQMVIPVMRTNGTRGSTACANLVRGLWSSKADTRMRRRIEPGTWAASSSVPRWQSKETVGLARRREASLIIPNPGMEGTQTPSLWGWRVNIVTITKIELTLSSPQDQTILFFDNAQDGKSWTTMIMRLTYNSGMMKWSQPLRVFTIIRKRTGSSVSLPARWEGKLVRFYHPFRNISMLFLLYSYPNQCNAKVVLRSLTKKMAPKMNHLCVENYPVGCWFNRASTTSIAISFRCHMSIVSHLFNQDLSRYHFFWQSPFSL